MHLYLDLIGFCIFQNTTQLSKTCVNGGGEKVTTCCSLECSRPVSSFSRERKEAILFLCSTVIQQLLCQACAADLRGASPSTSVLHQDKPLRGAGWEAEQQYWSLSISDVRGNYPDEGCKPSDLCNRCTVCYRLLSIHRTGIKKKRMTIYIMKQYFVTLWQREGWFWNTKEQNTVNETIINIQKLRHFGKLFSIYLYIDYCTLIGRSSLW